MLQRSEPGHRLLIDQIMTGRQSLQPGDTAGEQQLSVSSEVSALCLLIGNKLTLGSQFPIYKRFTRQAAESAYREHGPADAAASSLCVTLGAFSSKYTGR